MGAEKIHVGGKAYRRFIPPPGPVKDGTSRCFQCGQIDEPEYHDSQVCQDVATGDYKGAGLKVVLRADSGFRSETQARVSVNQWTQICAIIEGMQS